MCKSALWIRKCNWNVSGQLPAMIPGKRFENLSKYTSLKM